jgi:hypothetical protein
MSQTAPNLMRLCWRLGTDDLGAVQKNLEASVAEALTREQIRREPCWTESQVVGSTEYVGRMQPLTCRGKRRQLWRQPMGCGHCGRLRFLTEKKRASKARHSIAFNDIKKGNIQNASNLLW